MTTDPWPVRARSMTARIALPSDSRPTKGVRSARENGETSSTGIACGRSAGGEAGLSLAAGCSVASLGEPASVAANSHAIGKSGSGWYEQKVPVLMHLEKIFPSAASFCAILSSTDLIVLVIVCRARSEADLALRSRPPNPTARESSLLAHRSRPQLFLRVPCFRTLWLLPIPLAIRNGAVDRPTWLDRPASRLRHRGP